MRVDLAVANTRAKRSFPIRWLSGVKLLSAAILILSAISITRASDTGAVLRGLQVTVATGLNTPSGTAVDAGGDIYVADVYNGRVLKLPRASTGLSCGTGCTVAGSGFLRPNAIALDTSGNIYVTDAGAQSLSRITAAGAQTTLATGLSGVSGVAVVADGTIFVAFAGAVARVASGGVVNSFVSGPAVPGGIAADGSGNVFLADTANNRVLRFSPAGRQSTVAAGLNAPQAVALDTMGNVYIADTGNNRVVSIAASATGAVCPAACTIAAAQVSVPAGVSVDASGNLYIADTGNNQVVKLAQDADFGTFAVVASNAAPRATLTLNYLLYSSSCAAPPAVAVLLHGVPGKDFTSSATDNVCTPGTPDALAIKVKFAPLFPGLRTGVVQMTDATGNSQVATYLHGNGTGPQITWTPGVVSTVLASPSPSAR